MHTDQCDKTFSKQRTYVTGWYIVSHDVISRSALILWLNAAFTLLGMETHLYTRKSTYLYPPKTHTHTQKKSDLATLFSSASNRKNRYNIFWPNIKKRKWKTGLFQVYTNRDADQDECTSTETGVLKLCYTI